MAIALKNLSPIRVSGQDFPRPQLFRNIPMLHWILAEVLEDWLRAVRPYQEQVDSAEGESEKIWAVASAMDDLQAPFLKCIFSYAFFFVSADQAYLKFYRGLNCANRLSSLCIGHRKPPRETSWVCKIHRIRDISIAHFPSEKADPIDSFAGMTWTPMSLGWPSGSGVDLEKLTFAAGRFRGKNASGQSVQSQDLEIPGIRILHQHCLSYLEQYDQMCCEYLRGLHNGIGT